MAETFEAERGLVAVVRIAGQETRVTGRAARMIRWVAANRDRLETPRVGQLQFDFGGQQLKVHLRESEIDEVPI